MGDTPQTPAAARAAPVVGIDLGTTNSLVAVVRAGEPVVLGEGDDRLVPSVVRYAPDGSRAEAVGRSARRHAVEFPERTISSVKRLMGRSIADAGADLPYLSYVVAEGPNRTARIAVAERLISPPEVSAAILRELKDRATRALGADVTRAVITVPAYFDDAQRQATRDAARLAGIEAIRIVNEPTAAALAYGVGLNLKKPSTIAVYDLGGGTFDISILRVTPAPPSEPRAQASGSLDQTTSLALGARADPAFFEVLSTAGDTHLGGDDADQLLVSLFLREMREHGLVGANDGEIDRSTMQALRQFAEATKVRLSSDALATVSITVGQRSAPTGGSENRPTSSYQRTISREEFETLIREWAARTIARCKQALRDARLTPSDIDTIVLVGGSTRIPLIRSIVGEFFGKPLYTALDPDLVVAMGAAVQASLLERALSGETPGASGGGAGGALLLDVLPLSLGVETIGGGVAKLIVRNSTVPARATEMFSTSVDGQTTIKLNIVQGEREMVSDCRSLGVFHLGGLPPMPAGMPQVEVEFLVDANGVLHVSAHERRSGQRASLQVVPNHGLTREEVDRIERESLAHAREDMTRHRIADLVINARMDIKWVRDALTRVRDKLDPNYVRELESSMAALAGLAAQADRDWRSVDADAFHHAKEALDRQSMRLHEVAITASLGGR